MTNVLAWAIFCAFALFSATGVAGQTGASGEPLAAERGPAAEEPGVIDEEQARDSEQTRALNRARKAHEARRAEAAARLEAEQAREKETLRLHGSVSGLARRESYLNHERYWTQREFDSVSRDPADLSAMARRGALERDLREIGSELRTIDPARQSAVRRLDTLRLR
jgi:hypothetical protein